MCSGVLLSTYSQNCSLNIDQTLSLFIPIVNTHINTEYIINIFKKLNLATISYVYFIPRNGFKSAQITVEYWHENVCVENLQEKINSKTDEARVVYDDPDYWILYNLNENNTTKEELYNKKIKNIKEQLRNIISEYTDNIDNIHFIRNELVNTINECTDNTDTELLYLQNNKNIKSRMYNTNSCCGAASDAWVPNYPQY